MKNYKTISVPSLKLDAGQREFSLHGGFLFVNGAPVQSYFSRNMFYWEEENAQGAIFLNYHGLMADVHILQDGKKTYGRAGSEMHYAINYKNGQGCHTMDLCFGITFDTKKNAHYYCGLVYDGEIVIPIPQDDQSKQGQKIMTVTVTEKELLKIALDTGNYRNEDAGFHIAAMELVFDAAYNSCSVLITEGVLNVDSYPASNIQNDITGEDTARGACTLDYQDGDKNSHHIRLEADAIKTKDGVRYYGSVTYDGKTALGMPQTDKEKAKQGSISCFKIAGKWNVILKKIKIHDGLEISMNVNTMPCVIENKSATKTYSATGKLVLNETLKNRDRFFQANAKITAKLQENCVALGFLEANLSVDELFSLDPPPSCEITDKSDPNKKIKMDGQAYAHHKSTEILTYLAAYYTADIKCSEGTMSYADLYGYTKEAAKTYIDDVHINILKEVEAEKDSSGSQYVVEFLKKFSDIILSSSYAGSSNTYIQKGFQGIDRPVGRCEYYLSDDHENALQREKGYHAATTIIDKYVYASLVPGLSKYMGADAEKWAEELYYNAVDKLPMIQLQCIGDRNKGTHISKMLAILDHKKRKIKDKLGGEVLKDSGGHEMEMPYAAALYAQIFNFSLAEIENQFQGIDGQASFFKILELFFGDLYDKIAGKKISDIPQEILDELDKELQKGREAFIEIHIAQLQNLIGFMTSIGDYSSAFVKYGQEIKLFGKFNSCLLYALMGMTYASVLGDWDSLTDEEKAQSLLGCIQSILSTVRQGLIWSSVSKLLNPEISAAERVEAAYRLKFSGTDFECIERMMPEVDGENINLTERLEQVSRKYSFSIKDENAAEVKLSGLSKFFAGFEIVFQLLNIALMAFAFIMSVIDLVNLFKYSYSDALKAVAVINTVVMGIAFIAGVASFVISFTALATTSAIASAIPIVGAVCMLLSFVFSIVEMFLYPKEKKPAIQLLIEEHLAVTVKSLAEPSKEWEEKTKGKNARLAIG